MSAPLSFTKSLVASSANAICLTQSGTAGALLVLNGASAGLVWPNAYSTGQVTVATLDTQRRVLITSAGNDSALKWTVIGTNDSGAAIKDVFSGANGAAASNLDFLTVTSIVPSANTASTVTVGTNTTGSTRWAMTDKYVMPMAMNFGFEVVSGSVTVTVEYTYDPYMPPSGYMSNIATAAATPNPVVFPMTGMTSLTTNADISLATANFRAWRMTITAGVGVGEVTGIQAGLTN